MAKLKLWNLGGDLLGRDFQEPRGKLVRDAGGVGWVNCWDVISSSPLTKLTWGR